MSGRKKLASPSVCLAKKKTKFLNELNFEKESPYSIFEYIHHYSRTVFTRFTIEIGSNRI
jgi:hypothetical protein